MAPAAVPVTNAVNYTRIADNVLANVDKSVRPLHFAWADCILLNTILLYLSFSLRQLR